MAQCLKSQPRSVFSSCWIFAFNSRSDRITVCFRAGVKSDAFLSFLVGLFIVITLTSQANQSAQRVNQMRWRDVRNLVTIQFFVNTQIIPWRVVRK